MSRPVAGRVYHARVADLYPADAPTRVSLYLRDTLLVYDAPPQWLAGLRPHDLVTLTVNKRGALAGIAPQPTHRPGRATPRGDALRWRQGLSRASQISRMALLEHRQRILRGIRAWFDGEGFLEVETPVLVRAPSPEAVFDPVSAGGDWLITSPEFQLKRMLVGGFERVYRLGPVFRAGELGALHNPEFTLLEWYRAHADSAALAEDLHGLLSALAPVAETCAPLWPAGTPAERLHALAAALRATPYTVATVRELFARHLGLDIAGVTTVEALRRAALAAGLEGAGTLPQDFSEAFSSLWVRLERALPPAPLLVTDWPAPTASLARLKADDATLAERVELYVGGMELANGFAELTDPAEQRRRFEVDRAARRAQGLREVPLDEAFLAALEEGMPPAAGMALGVDRLVMLLTGAERIGDVLAFAWDER